MTSFSSFKSVDIVELVILEVIDSPNTYKMPTFFVIVFLNLTKFDESKTNNKESEYLVISH